MLSTKTSNAGRWLTDLISIALVLGVFYALWIGSYALFTPDEGRYSEVAREMVTTGDYITPRLNGVVFLDKPILYYWLQASAIHLFGLKEWTLRFWPAFLGIFGALMTYVAGRSLFNRRTGILSAVILATCPLYYGASHYANLDLEVAVFVSSALLFFIVAMQTSSSRQRNGFLLASYFFAALAALTKGLIGIAFPAMIIGAWMLTLYRWDTLKKMRLFSGLLIFSVIALPWYFLVQKANPEFFQFFFVKQQVSRFLTTEHFNNRTPIWFYIPIVLAGLTPWYIFITQAITHHIKAVWQNRKNHPVELYLLLWLFLVFIFFSVPKSKTVGYILPIFPAIALLIGSYLNQYWEKATSKSILFGIRLFQLLSIGMIASCWIAIESHLFDIDPQLKPHLLLTAILFGVSGIVVTLLNHLKKSLLPIFVALVSTAMLFLLIIMTSAGAINQKTSKPLTSEIKSQLQPNDEVVAFYRYTQDLPIYLERRITIVANWTSKDIPLNDNWVRELWYGMPFQDTSAWLINETDFWHRWNSHKRLFVFTDSHYEQDFPKKSKRPVYKIAEFNKMVLLTNQRNTQSFPSVKLASGKIVSTKN